MPNWKKVIVSGSNAALTSVTATSGFTGSLLGTATTASNITPAISNDADTRIITANGNGTLNAESLLTFDGNILKLLYQSGDEGGEMLLNKPVTNTTIAGNGVTFDIYQNKLRFFEQGGSARGYYLDITAGGAGVGTNSRNSRYYWCTRNTRYNRCTRYNRYSRCYWYSRNNRSTRYNRCSRYYWYSRYNRNTRSSWYTRNYWYTRYNWSSRSNRNSRCYWNNWSTRNNWCNRLTRSYWSNRITRSNWYTRN